MAFITCAQVLTLLRSRGFGGEEDDGKHPYVIQPYKNYSNNWQELLPEDKRKQPGIVINELKNIELEIEDKNRTAEELWKTHCPSDVESDPNDVDHDALLKELQQRVARDPRVQDVDALTRLDRLHHLNKDKNGLLGLFRPKIDVCDCPQQDLGQSSKLKSNVLKNSNGGRFHAVIVGINRYDDPRTPALNGCVHDALLFREYLIQDLSVPSDRITLLLSPTAGDKLIPFPYKAPTRENILNALYALYDNHKIKSDDSIVFFYAGHGQSYLPGTWTPHSTGSIEAISPVDRNTRRSNSDGIDETVLDISDREINVILGEIAKKRSENITVILDCCYAGGGTRSASTSSDSLQLADKERLTARNCPAIPDAVEPMFKAADASRRLPSDRPRTAVIDFRPNMRSHVLVASAKDYEEALEYTDRVTGVSQGYFTSRFISALRSSTSSATYRDVIGSPGLVMPFQTALAAGRKTAKLWFA